MEVDYYDLLNVSPDADSEVIRAAFYEQTILYQSEDDRFEQISEAYAVLIDPRSRSAYDRRRNGGQTEDETEESEASADAADSVSVQEMSNLAYELTMQNHSGLMIEQELTSKGCSEELASSIVNTVEHQRKSIVRRAAFTPMLSAAVSLIVGVIALLIMNRVFPDRGVASLPIAFFVFSAFSFTRAAYFLITGRTSRQEANAFNAMSEHSERMKEKWECPQCRHKNPNTIFTCEACGYHLL